MLLIEALRSNLKQQCKADADAKYSICFSLQLLDVSENFVTVVEKLSFKDLYLAKINLSRNEISKIEAGAFENCVNITILDLSHNKLENISRYSFDSATYATELRLSYNRFTAVNQVSFGGE